MLRYKLTPVESLKRGDMLDMADDKLIRHTRNSDTMYDHLDKLDNNFVEVLAIKRASMTVTILSQWGDIVFPMGHTVNVFQETA